MSRYVLVLACVALIAAFATAAPAKEEPVDPSSGPAGGLLDAFKAAGGQLQRVADGLPLSFSSAASRFQSWAEGAGSSAGKSATDAFGFTRQLFKPLRTEDVRPPSSDSSS
ncbi:uncharacterized protein LOC144093508 [Amblyomma americanum]